MTQPKTNAYLVFTIAFVIVTFGAMNSVLSSAYLPDILKDLKVDASNESLIGAWINCAFLAGGAIGGIAFGFLSDHVGRRKALLWALVFYSAGSAAGAAMHNWQLLALTRFFVGIGVGTALVISVVVLSEIWSSRTKAVALGILSVAYPAGIIASGIITSNISNWRTAFMIGAASILLVIPTRYLVPETYQKNIKGPGLNEVTPAGYRSNLLLGILVYGTMLIGLWSTFSWLPTWVQSLLTNNSEEGQSYRGLAVTLLGVGGLAGSLVSGWLGNMLGLRIVQGICFVLSFVLSFWMFRLSNTLSLQILVGCGLLGLCFGISQGILNTFIPELFPYRLRSSATGLCFHAGRAFTAVAVFFVGAWAVWLGGYGNAIFVFSWVYIIGLLALMLMKRAAVYLSGETQTTS